MARSEWTRWTHFAIAEALPGAAWGTGGIGLADFDGDGRPEVIVSRRETQTAYRFVRVDDATWERYIVAAAPQLAQTLGAAVLDIDGDGLPDIAFNGVWFRNPGRLDIDPDAPWDARLYDGGGHDVIAADISGNGRLDLVTYDGITLAWFDPSKGLAKTIIADGRDDHAGIAPHGFGDLNGNGWNDLVVAGVWYENPGPGGGPWASHPWPHRGVDRASYGTSIRSWVADVNGSGRADIVYADCDTGNGHVYWVENLGGGESWALHPLADPEGATGVPHAHDANTGSWHSLAVADFNGDGRLEIFAGEQEDPDTMMTDWGRVPMKPAGLKERGVLWVRSDKDEVDFEPVVIHEGRPGWHDVVVGDIDGDGDLDLVSKIWNADGPNYSVDYWRNDLRMTSDD